MQKKAESFARGVLAFRNTVGWWVFLTFAYTIVYALLFPSAPFTLIFSLNMSAFTMMAIDKQNAGKGRWRVPEKFLYLMAVLFGSIGVLAGTQIFHHKLRKTNFMFVLAAIIFIQIGLVAAYMLGL